MRHARTRFLFFRRPLLNRLSRRTGVPLRIQPLRHRRQNAQEQQQSQRRMDVRLPQRPDRRYRYLQYDSYDPLRKSAIGQPQTAKAANKPTTAKMDRNLIQKRNNGNRTFSWKYYKDNVTVQHRKQYHDNFRR